MLLAWSKLLSSVQELRSSGVQLARAVGPGLEHAAEPITRPQVCEKEAGPSGGQLLTDFVLLNNSERDLPMDGLRAFSPSDTSASASS